MQSSSPFWLPLLHRLITASSRIYALQQRLFALDYRDACKAFRPLLPPPGARILDIGCGTADLALRLLGDQYDYTGMDSNAAYIESNRRRYPHGRFICADRLDDPAIPDHAFDCALVFHLIHHLDDATARAFVSQLRRVLAPEGLILVSELLFWPPPVKSIRQRVSNTLVRWDRGEHIRDIEGYKRIFSDLRLVEAAEYVYTIHRCWAAKYVIG